MLFVVFSTPLAILCAYLSYLTFSRKKIGAAIILALCSVMFFTIAFLGVGTSYFMYDTLSKN